MEGIKILDIASNGLLSAGAWFYDGNIYALSQTADQHKICLSVFTKDFSLRQSEIVYESESKLANPRVLFFRDIGKLNVGLQIEKKGLDFYHIAYLTMPADLKGRFAPVVLSDLGPGKNIIPLTKYDWCFTPCLNKRSIVVFRIEGRAKGFQLIELPNVAWGKNVLRLSAPPFWISPSQAILIFYGIDRQKGVRTCSLGCGKLIFDRGKFNLLSIDKNPFWQEESCQAPFICSSIVLIDNQVYIFLTQGEKTKVLVIDNLVNFLNPY